MTMNMMIPGLRMNVMIDNVCSCSKEFCLILLYSFISMNSVKKHNKCETIDY